MFFVFTYIAPICAMLFAYGQIGYVLWGKSTPDDEHATQHDLAVQRKLIAKRNVSFQSKLG